MTDPPGSSGVDAQRLVRVPGPDPLQPTPLECHELADLLAWDDTSGREPARR